MCLFSRANFLMGGTLVAFVVAAGLFAALRERSEVKLVENMEEGKQESKMSLPSSERVSIEAEGEEYSSGVPANRFVEPIDRAAERVTRKPFGIFIDPETSPVSPERFRGYHTGVDFEIFPEEADREVSIRAVCEGVLLEKRVVSGYGGVAVQSCVREGEPVTVLYGHLRLSSISAVIGDRLVAGEKIGVLGVGSSSETDGERKHLHFGIFRGGGMDVRGYVSSESALSAWIDPCLVVCS